MNKISTPAVEALARLRVNSDFQVVVEEIKRELDDLRMDLMAQKDDVLLRQAQGRSQALSELLYLYDRASEILAKRQGSNTQSTT